jgi:hypothetical protein
VEAAMPVILVAGTPALMMQAMVLVQHQVMGLRAAVAAGPATQASPVTEVSLALKATWISVTAARMVPALLLSGAAGHIVALKREWAAQSQASSMGRTAATAAVLLHCVFVSFS